MISLLSKLSRLLEPPVITRQRVWFAYAVAIGTDTVRCCWGHSDGSG
jgi:hypothetical protein